MKFNINEMVRVKLTKHGKTIHADDHALFLASVNHPNPPAYIAPKEDENGWSNWQLWTLMEAFGKHIHLGAEPCFETTIELVCVYANKETEQ